MMEEFVDKLQTRSQGVYNKSDLLSVTCGLHFTSLREFNAVPELAVTRLLQFRLVGQFCNLTKLVYSHPLAGVRTLIYNIHHHLSIHD